MKKLNSILVTMLAVAAVTPCFADGSKWRQENDSPAIMIKYKGTGLATATVNKTSLTLVQNGMAAESLILTNGSPTAGWINARTNSDGRNPWLARIFCTTGTESISNKLVSGTNAMTIGEWNEDVFRWHTQDADHYDVSLSYMQGDFPVNSGNRVTGLFGYPEGTGDVTVAVYEGATVKYKSVIVSPTYTRPAQEGTVVTNTVYNGVNLEGLNVGTGIHIGDGKVGFLRATRGTSAQGGGVGLSWAD